MFLSGISLLSCGMRILIRFRIPLEQGEETLFLHQMNQLSVMMIHKKTIILLCFILCGIIPVMVAASLPMVGFPLRPSPEVGPYQDEEFLEKANTTIYGLSNQSVPSGTGLRSMQSLQQKMARMNISPELYEEAADINSFLYYTVKAGSEFDDAMSLSRSEYSPISRDGPLFEDATKYYNAAKKVWDRIKTRYPGVTLYTMTVSSESSAGDGPVGNGDDYVSRQAMTGLW